MSINRPAGGFQAALLQTNGVDIAQRATSIVVPFSAQILEFMNPPSRSPENQQRLQIEVQSWILQVVRLMQEKSNAVPDLISFEGADSLFLDHTETWERQTARLINQQFDIPVAFHFWTPTNKEQFQRIWNASYYGAVLREQASMTGDPLTEQTAFVILEDKISVYFLKKNNENVSKLTTLVSEPGYSMLRDLSERFFQSADKNGHLASRGTLNIRVLNELLMLEKKSKSTEARSRNTFAIHRALELGPLNALTTLTAFITQCLVNRLKRERSISQLVLMGSFAHHGFIRTWLSRTFRLVDAHQWMPNVENLPPEICAYNAIRCLFHLPSLLAGNQRTATVLKGLLADPSGTLRTWMDEPLPNTQCNQLELLTEQSLMDS